MSNITRNVFPYENHEFDIRVGTLDDDGRSDEDDRTYGLDENYDSGVLDISIHGTDGNDRLSGGPNDDIIKGGKGLDQLYGGEGKDHIYGGADNDWLYGDDDNDDLFGEDGCDHLWGGYNNDYLDGGELNDWLNGGPDDDALRGGAGADNLTGGSGLDQFAFAMSENTLFEGHDSHSFNPDTIWDFNHNYDTIVLEGWNFFPSDSQYVEDTIDYGAGYDAAKLHAESLLNADVSKSYVFVTDEVDGYLFVDWFKPDGEISVWWGVEAGIILKGLTSEFDFDSSGVTTGLFW